VTSPNEPGYPRAGDGAGGANGSVGGSADGGSPGSTAARTGKVTDPGDVPPWQRGPAARTASQHRPTQEATARETRGGNRSEPRSGSATGHSPGVDARLNRFISGGGAPSSSAHEPEATTRAPDRDNTQRAPERDTTQQRVSERDTTQQRAPERVEHGPSEAYASELPDLSGPTPRSPQQRKPAQERSAQESSRAVAATSRVQVGTRHKGPVRASMQIRRIDPWSALKVSLVLSVALFFVWMIAVAFLYLVLGGMGVWSKLNSNVGDLLTSASGQTGGELVSSGTIFGGATLIGLVNIVLLTAMATIGAFIYNLTTDLVGGVEVTLADRD